MEIVSSFLTPLLFQYEGFLTISFSLVEIIENTDCMAFHIDAITFHI